MANYIKQMARGCCSCQKSPNSSNSEEDIKIDSHDYIEIGGTKWATCNIGATNPWDTGLYFQWGDTQGYTASQVGDGEGLKYFGWEDYKYGNGTSNLTASDMTKYNSTDDKIVLDLSDDAARAAWGGAWRMPTENEFIALGNAVNTEWTADYQDSGVAGLVCTDKTDSSKILFFPACNSADYGGVNSIDYGHYWSSSLYSDSDCSQAHFFEFNIDFVTWNSMSIRYYGYSVRGVLAEN